jgi:uncharacterized protein YkwD
MRVVLHCRSAVVIAGFLWAATTLASAGRDQAPPSGQTDGAASQSQDQAAPKNESGAWRHFGASDQAPETAPSKPGVWRHFGAKDAPPKTAARQPARRERSSGRSVAELEKQMYELINRDRSDPGNAAETRGRAVPLRWNEKLAAVARAHSRNMLTQGFFDHVDPQGKSSGERVMAAGIMWESMGENIAMHYDVTGAESAFMNEPRFEHNHRGNILNSKYTDVGVGIVQGPGGRYYITQEFIENPAGVRALGALGEGSTVSGEARQATPSGH